MASSWRADQGHTHAMCIVEVVTSHAVNVTAIWC